MRAMVFAVLFGLGAAGCASADKRWAEDVGRLAQDRGLAASSIRPSEAEPEAAKAIDELLNKPLTEDAAVRIALLNNAGLKATYADLEVTQADLVGSGLLKNPVVTGHFGFSTSGGKEIAVSAAQDLISLLSAPLRRRLGAKQFQQAKLRVANAVLRLASDTRAAFYAWQTAGQVLSMRRTVLESARAAAELSERQLKAGNANLLEHGSQEVLAEQTETDALRAEAEATAARERLNELMGLSGERAMSWRTQGPLPELPGLDPSPEEIEKFAFSQRLDLAAARMEIDIQERRRSLSRFAFLPEASVGMDWHREPEEESVTRTATGPSLELSLPVFDRGQNVRAGARAQLAAARHRLAALETSIRAELRTTHSALSAARRIAERYRDKVVPLHERLVAEAQRHYNYMLIGVYQLIEFKRSEIAAKREYGEALRDYWTTWAELERAVGGKIAAGAPTTPPQPQQEPPKESGQPKGEKP